VAVSVDGGPMKLVGIIPMLDPPREDTTWVIEKMYEAGIEVKMVTGKRNAQPCPRTLTEGILRGTCQENRRKPLH
jgi:cation transport ATPase